MSAGQAATTGAAARPVLQLPTAVIQLGCASSACCIADGLCLPLDFLKTRMQLQNELVASGAPRLGVFSMAARVLRTEGVLTFFDGLPAAMMRQASYGGLCFASYPALRDKLNPHSDGKHAPLASKLAAGALAGGTASALANPTDVVKVRIQADGRLRLLGEPARYSGTAQAFRAILAQEGLAAFWKGVGPNMQRAAVVNGAGIATYDQCKQTVTRLMGEDDSLRARCLAALMGGVVTALVGCPFDVVKTRLMNQHEGKRLYRSVSDCFVSIVRVEGVLALWKGLLPVYLRQAPFNLLNYLVLEQLTQTFLGRTIM